jgi:hypothetical protein
MSWWRNEMDMKYSERIMNRAADAPSKTRHACALIAHEADAEIERLSAALKTANEQAEKFERSWYLRGDALEKLEQWARAYPLSVFPEPDLKRAHELLTAGGISFDSVSASNMRHVIEQTKKIVEEGLRAY